MYPVHILVGLPDILSFYVAFLSMSRQMPEQCLQINHDLLPHIVDHLMIPFDIIQPLQLKQHYQIA